MPMLQLYFACLNDLNFCNQVAHTFFLLFFSVSISFFFGKCVVTLLVNLHFYCFHIPPFQYYLKTGTCKFGATCKFHHPREKAAMATRVQLNELGYPLRPVCSEFLLRFTMFHDMDAQCGATFLCNFFARFASLT